jgi:hypothetical protein
MSTSNHILTAEQRTSLIQGALEGELCAGGGGQPALLIGFDRLQLARQPTALVSAFA